MNARRKITFPARQSGFNLPELMVAITIGLIIMVAVSAVFVSSKRTYATQDRLARLQENARFAIHYLTRDLRMAGYSGCMSEVSTVNNTLNGGTLFFNPSVAVEGLENANSSGSSGTWYPSGNTSISGIKAGTDALLIRRADPTLNVSVSTPMPNESAELNVSSVTGLSEGSIIMVSDCASADVMQITAVQTSALKVQHNPGGASAPGNSTQKLSKQYGSSAKVMSFVANLYYVKNKTDPNDATKTIPTLYMRTNDGSEQELVEGVEDLQITYGLDTAGASSDGIPDRYVTATTVGATAANWALVKSVRIGLLLRTTNDKDADATIKTSYDVNGRTYSVAATDKYQRRVFLTTVLLRNL